MSAVLCVRGVALLCVCCKLRAAPVLGWHPEPQLERGGLLCPLHTVARSEDDLGINLEQAGTQTKTCRFAGPTQKCHRSDRAKVHPFGEMGSAQKT